MAQSLYWLFWYFAVYAVLGWCLEVCFCTINTCLLYTSRCV